MLSLSLCSEIKKGWLAHGRKRISSNIGVRTPKMIEITQLHIKVKL